MDKLIVKKYRHSSEIFRGFLYKELTICEAFCYRKKIKRAERLQMFFSCPDSTVKNLLSAFRNLKVLL